MERKPLVATLLFGAVVAAWLLLRGGSGGRSEVVLPTFAPRTVVVLCCEAVASMHLEAELARGTGLLWAHEHVESGELEACKKLFARPVVIRGELESLFDRFSAVDDLVVFDTNVKQPTSTFVMHTLLAKGVRLELRTVVVMPVMPNTAEDGERVALMGKEHARFKLLVKQLKRHGKIEAGFGYHPERMAARWKAIERSLDVVPGEFDTSAYCVDWGSNAGFFSVKLAQRFPGGWVMGVEGEAVAEYAEARKTHLEMATKAGVLQNTVICNTKVSGKEFEMITDKWQFDVQLSLSVFHWFKMTDHEDFLEKLGFHLAEATGDDAFCLVCFADTF